MIVSEKLSTVGTYLYPADADVAETSLDAAGIEAFLHDENYVRLNWFYSNALGGVKVRVREEDAGAAADVLAGADDVGEPEEEIEPPAAPQICPECGSTDVSFVTKWAVFFVIAALATATGIAMGEGETLFFFIPALFLLTIMWRPRRCNSCGERWS